MRSLLIAILMCAAVIFAQSNRGDIKGTVSDRLGHAIASAPIEATSADSGTRYTSTSDGTGQYALSLLAGKYDLAVEVVGHKYLQQGIVVTPERPLTIDVTLAIP